MVVFIAILASGHYEVRTVTVQEVVLLMYAYNR